MKSLEKNFLRFTFVKHSVFIYEDIIKDFNCEYFIKKINDNINKKISHVTSVKNLMTDWNTFVDDQELRKIIYNYSDLFNYVLKTPKLTILNAWGTKSLDYVETSEHNHGLGVSAIIFLSEGGPGTYFPEFEYNSDEKIGKIIFFDSRLNHSVKKTKIDNTRYLISFNLTEVKSWEDTLNYKTNR